MSEQLRVNEVFQSIQGEGFHAGKLTTFVRLFGCNLKCPWCDTDYAKIDQNFSLMSVEELIERVLVVSRHRQVLTLTGGEPLLQKGEALETFLTWATSQFKLVTIETNGTINWDIPNTVWLTVSPKPNNYEINLPLERIHEIKLVVSDELSDRVLETCEKYCKNAVFLLQPCGTSPGAVQKALMMQLQHPNWIFRLQMHKYLGLR